MKKDNVEYEVGNSPFETCGPLSRITFTWINDIIRQGAKKPLEDSDIPALPKIFTCQRVRTFAIIEWDIEKKKANPSIFYAMIRAFFYDFGLAAVLFMPYVVVVLLQPYFVTSLIKYVSTGHSSFLGIESGVGQAIVLGLLSFCGVIAISSSFYFTSTAAIPIKSACIALIFEKSLKLSSSARTEFTTGTLVLLYTIWFSVLNF